MLAYYIVIAQKREKLGIVDYIYKYYYYYFCK